MTAAVISPQVNDIGPKAGGDLAHDEKTTTLKSQDYSSHYKSWPNADGFETTYTENDPVELAVVGNIPSYAAGILYRTGPGDHRIKDCKDGKTWTADHWFDGLTTIHRFQIKAEPTGTKVIYNSRRTVDKLVQEIRQSGKLNGFTFGQKRDPCKSVFKKLMSTFESPDKDKSEFSQQNVGVAMSVNMPGLQTPCPASKDSDIKSLITRTDANAYVYIDPDTLEPAGVARQDVLHKDLTGQLAATHAKMCPKTGDVFNYNLNVAAQHTYRVFCASPSTQKTTVLATIEAPAAYLHSLFLTENYVVLCIWSSHFSYKGISMLYNRNILDAIASPSAMANTDARWYVIKRKPQTPGKGLVRVYTSPPFFAFHAVNAYEEPSTTVEGGIDIVADIPAFPDTGVLKMFYYENLKSNSPKAPTFAEMHSVRYQPRLTRFRLPDIPKRSTSGRPDKATKDWEMPGSRNLELPTINPAYATTKHRYIYGPTHRGASSFFDGLAKFDTKTQTEILWHHQGQSTGEPIFVRNPNGTDEDDGVLLVVVLDGFEGHSYLLCLNAKDLTELGRANVKGVVGFGFHGLHVGKGSGEEKDGNPGVSMGD